MLYQIIMVMLDSGIIQLMLEILLQMNGTHLMMLMLVKKIQIALYQKHHTFYFMKELFNDKTLLYQYIKD